MAVPRTSARLQPPSYLAAAATHDTTSTLSTTSTPINNGGSSNINIIFFASCTINFTQLPRLLHAFIIFINTAARRLHAAHSTGFFLQPSSPSASSSPPHPSTSATPTAMATQPWQLHARHMMIIDHHQQHAAPHGSSSAFHDHHHNQPSPSRPNTTTHDYHHLHHLHDHVAPPRPRHDHHHHRLSLCSRQHHHVCVNEEAEGRRENK